MHFVIEEQLNIIENDKNVVKLAQKNISSKNLSFSSNNEDTILNKLNCKTKKKQSMPIFFSNMPKDGSDRQINRNIILNENSKNYLLNSIKR